MPILINSRDNITANLNKFYSSLFMVFVMGVIEIGIILMQSGFSSFEFIFFVIFVFLSIIMGIIIREQVGINEDQFMLSMIEHHAMALQMVEKTKDTYKDIRVVKLGDDISSSQKEEIKLMKKLLRDHKEIS